MSEASVIVITEKLREAVTSVRAGYQYASNVLAGVIEIIEQDYIVQPRCTADLGTPDLRCNMPAGNHGVKHRTKLEDGSEVFFENLVDNSTGEG